MDLGQKANGKISLGAGHLRGHFSIYDKKVILKVYERSNLFILSTSSCIRTSGQSQKKSLLRRSVRHTEGPSDIVC